MTLSSANKKVREICDVIRNETLRPAQAEANRIIKDAEIIADDILDKANKEIKIKEDESNERLKKALEVHHSVLNLAIKHSMSKLKQSIEEIFSNEWQEMMRHEMQKEDVIAKLINVVVESIEKDGIDTELMVVIPKSISQESISGFLTDKIRKRLKKGCIVLGDIQSGIELKLIKEKVSVDISDKSMIALLSKYVSSELREKIFL